MARIFYSMAGEGRGHATRVRAIVEQLRQDHQLYLFAPHHAFQILSDVYGNDPEVHLEQIPGLLCSYRGAKLDYLKTFSQGIPYYLKQLPDLVARLQQRIGEYQPDLAITDFEPALPRAAKKCDLPFVSFDHQHFLTVNDLSSLPLKLKPKTWFMGAFVRLFYTGQQKTIVSSFYSPPLKSNSNAVQTGVMLRPEIAGAHPEEGEHLLVYLRRFAQPNLLEALGECGREVRVYGLGGRPSEGRVHYFEIDERGFIEDLRTCHALVSNAGNQLVGEAFYLRKPVLALPETGNYEQQVNAHFVRASGSGDWSRYERIGIQELREFLAQVPRFRDSIDTKSVVGNEIAVREILAHLPEASPVKSEPLPAVQIA